MKTAKIFVITLLLGVVSIFYSSHTVEARAANQSCDSTYIDTIITCFPYFWDVTDTTYFFTGVYADTLQSAQGCDSIRVIDLTVYTSYQTTSSVFICQGEQFVWNNRLLFETGVYDDTLQTINGCDSILRLNLTVDPVDTSISRIGNSLRANISPAASYQWFDCDGDSLIPGATNRTYTPSRSGIYKVRVNDFGCIDFSGCYTFVLSSLENALVTDIKVFPNPTSNHLFVQVPGALEVHDVRVLTIIGNMVMNIKPSELRKGINTTSLKAGMYHLVLEGKDFRQELRFLKE